MKFSRIFGAAACAAFVALVPRVSQASMPLSLDVDFATPVDEPGVDSGMGGQLRFGPRLDLKLLTLDAELGLGAHQLGGNLSPTIYRGVVGSRLGLALGLRPSIFAHIGVGHVDYSGTAPDLTHLTADVGLALDFTLLPIIDLGAHAAYNTIAGDGTLSPFSYATIGGHITFVLD